MVKVVVGDVVVLKQVIDAYCSISGQAINLAKSQIMISLATSSATKANIKRVMTVNENRGLWKYLGILLPVKAWNKEAFSFITAKMTARIAS